MNSKTVLNKILSLLSKDEVALTYAKLADGTIVESATFDVGEDLFVISEDGTKTPAPNGTHDLMLKDEEGNENMMKVKTEDGKIVERENVEMAAEDLDVVPVEEIPQASGDLQKVNEVPDQKNQVKDGTLNMEEETIEDDEDMPETDGEEMKKEMEIELGKKLEEMAYRIEEMEKKMMKMEEAMMPPVDSMVDEEVAMAAEPDEDEELPKLDGAPIEEGFKFSAENRKNYGKKIVDSQSSFLSKLYK
jgi:hypothetical protein